MVDALKAARERDCCKNLEELDAMALADTGGLKTTKATLAKAIDK